MNALEIASRALQTRAGGAMTTGDFPLLLADLQTKTLLDGYRERPPTFWRFARRMSFPDFRARKSLRLGALPRLPVVAEGEEYDLVTMGEGEMTLAIAKRGFILGVTLELMINDDLGALLGIPARVGNAAARTEEYVAYDGILFSSALLADGDTLFSASRDNVVDAGSFAALTAGPLDSATNATTQIGHIRRIFAERALETLDDGSTIEPDLELDYILTPQRYADPIDRALGRTLAGLVSDVESVVTAAAGGVEPIVVGRMSRRSATVSTASVVGGTSVIGVTRGVPGLAMGYLTGADGGITVAEDTAFTSDMLRTRYRHIFGGGIEDANAFVHDPGVAL